VPGLLRLLGRELRLKQDFERDYQRFKPALNQLAEQSTSNLSGGAIGTGGLNLNLLKRATYYSILAPLSASLRQAVLRVKDTEVDHSQTPEVASLRSLSLQLRLTSYYRSWQMVQSLTCWLQVRRDEES